MNICLVTASSEIGYNKLATPHYYAPMGVGLFIPKIMQNNVHSLQIPHFPHITSGQISLIDLA